jgi:hypothetical protein
MYQPCVQLIHLQTHFIISVKSYITERTVEYRLSHLKSPLLDEEEPKFLQDIMHLYGLDVQLQWSVKALEELELADVALRSKRVVGGVLVRRNKGRSRNYDQCMSGVVAQGLPFSDE